MVSLTSSRKALAFSRSSGPQSEPKLGSEAPLRSSMPNERRPSPDKSVGESSPPVASNLKFSPLVHMSSAAKHKQNVGKMGLQDSTTRLRRD